MFEVVTVDAAGRPVVGGGRFALLMTRDDFQGQLGVVPIVPYADAEGQVTQFQVQGFAVGGLSLPGTPNQWFFMNRASPRAEVVTEEKKPGFTRPFRNE